jgi:hypothetical protein
MMIRGEPNKAVGCRPEAKEALPTASSLERFSLGCSSDCFPARSEPFASAHSESFDHTQDKLRRVTPKPALNIVEGSKNAQDKLRRKSGQLVSAMPRAMRMPCVGRWVC